MGPGNRHSDTPRSDDYRPGLESSACGPPLRCSVAGLGRIASTLEKDSLREKPCTHIGAIVENPDCVLISGCDRDAEARRRFLDDWGSLDPVPQVFAYIDELLSAEVPDILIVATYPESHHYMVKKAAKAGVPVVVCEKPVAETLRDAGKIAKIHRAGRTKVLVNHERRYSADYRAVRSLLADRRYGAVCSVRATLYFGKTTRLKDMLLHDGTHLVDIINFLLAGPLRLSRRFGTFRSKQGSAFLFGKAGEVPVVVEVGAGRDHLVFEVEISCKKGRVRVGNGVLRFEKSAESPYYEGYRSLVPDEVPVIGKTGYFSNMIADAVRCVREAGHCPDSSAADALQVMRFIRATRFEALPKFIR